MPRVTPGENEPSTLAGELGEDGWSHLDLEALGVGVHLAVQGGGPGVLIDGRQLVDEADRRWNPTRPDSLVAQIEAAGGEAVPVDDETYALVEASVAAAEQTDGAVGSEGLVLNALLTRVGAPEGSTFDVDDLARARTADSVAEALLDRGADGAVVDVGGAVRVAGTVPEDRGWIVAVLEADGEEAALAVASGAAVTVVRPTSALASVTVLGPDAVTVMVLAAAGDLGLLEASGLPAVVVEDGGGVLALGEAAELLRQ